MLSNPFSTNETNGTTRHQTEPVISYIELLQVSDYEKEPAAPKKKKRRGVKHRKSTKGK